MECTFVAVVIKECGALLRNSTLFLYLVVFSVFFSICFIFIFVVTLVRQHQEEKGAIAIW